MTKVDEIKGKGNAAVGKSTDKAIRRVFADYGMTKPETEELNELTEVCRSTLRCVDLDVDEEIEGACERFLGARVG